MHSVQSRALFLGGPSMHLISPQNIAIFVKDT